MLPIAYPPFRGEDPYIIDLALAKGKWSEWFPKEDAPNLSIKSNEL